MIPEKQFILLGRRMYKLHYISELCENLNWEIYGFLKPIKFHDWWKQTSNFSLEDYNRLCSLTDSNCKEILDTYNYISSTNNNIKHFQNIISGLLSPRGVERINKKELSSITDPKLKKILLGERVRKVQISTLLSLTRYYIWKMYQTYILSGYYTQRQLKEQHDIFSSDAENEVLYGADKVKNILSAISDSSESMESQADMVSAKHLIKQNQEEFETVISQDIRLVEKQLSGFQQTSNLIWIALNSNLLSKEIRQKLVNIITFSPLRKVCQNLYDEYRMYHEKALPLSFINTFRPNVVLPKDFDKGEAATESLGQKLKFAQVVSLYKSLIKDHYISPTTDILNLCYALTGYPYDYSSRFYPVNWISRSKQSLGIFIGLLRPKKKEGKWYWNKATNLFRYNGQSFTAKQLSSAFGKFLNFPETRGKDWENINKLLSEVLNCH